MMNNTTISSLNRLKEQIGIFLIATVFICTPVIPFVIPEKALLPSYAPIFGFICGGICGIFLLLIWSKPAFKKYLYYFIVIAITLGVYSCLTYAYWLDLRERDASAVIYFSMLSAFHFNSIRDLVLFYVIIFIGVLYISFNIPNPHIDVTYFIIRFVIFNLIALGFFSIFRKTLDSFSEREYGYTQLFQMMNGH